MASAAPPRMAFLFPTVTPMELAGRPTVNQLIRSHKRKAPLRLYQHANKVYPKATKAITGGVLGGLGDAVAQYLEGRGKAKTSATSSTREANTTDTFDFKRFFAFTGFNLIWAGLPLHFYINFLENKRRNFTLLQKMIVTHLCYNPFLYFPSFYLLHGGFMGQSLSHILDYRLKEELPTALSQCLQFWIPINMIQYTAVSANKQVLFLSLANVAWCVILSSNSNAGAAEGSDSASSTSSSSVRERSAPVLQHQKTQPIRVEDGVMAVVDFVDPHRRTEEATERGTAAEQEDFTAGGLLYPEERGKMLRLVRNSAEGGVVDEGGLAEKI